MRIFLATNSHGRGRSIYIVAPNVSDAKQVALSIKRFCKTDVTIRYVDTTDEMINLYNIDLSKFKIGQIVRKNTRRLGIHWANV